VGPVPEHPLIAEGIDRQLERLPCPVVGGLLPHLGRLVIDDQGLVVNPVHAVPVPDHLGLPLHEGEELLDERRLRAGGLLKPVERGQGGRAVAEHLLLVGGGQEPLRAPGVAEHGLEFGEGEGPPLDLGEVVGLDRLVDRVAEDDDRMKADRDAQHMDVAVLEGTGEPVVHLAEGELERPRALGTRGGWRGFPPLAADPEQGRRLGGSFPLFAEGLEDEPRHLRHPLSGRLARRTVIIGGEEVQTAFGAGHPHVEQAPLLLEVGDVLRDVLPPQAAGEDERGPRDPPREEVLHQPGEEHGHELHPLCLVERHHLHRVHPRLRLPDHWVPPQLPQLVHVAHEPRHAVVAGHLLEPMHHPLEELGDVLDRLPGGGVIGLGEGLEVAGALHQERVEDAPGRVAPREVLARREVGQRPCGRLLALLAQGASGDGRGEDLAKRAVFPLGARGEESEVLPPQAVDRGPEEMVEGLAIPGVGERAQKRHHEPDDLLVEHPGPEPAREGPRDPLLGQGAQVRVRAVPVPVQERYFPVRDAGRVQLAHFPRHKLRFLFHRWELAVHRGVPWTVDRGELLGDRVRDLPAEGESLQAVGIGADEPRRGIQDPLG